MDNDAFQQILAEEGIDAEQNLIAELRERQLNLDLDEQGLREEARHTLLREAFNRAMDPLLGRH